MFNKKIARIISCVLLSALVLFTGAEAVSATETESIEMGDVSDLSSDMIEDSEGEDSFISETESDTTDEVVDEADESIVVEESYEEIMYAGVNPYSNEIITGMDENGNIYEWVEDVPDIMGLSPYARTTDPLLVDFHTKESTVNTNYTEVSTGKSGYTNGSYGADALYLGIVDGKVKFMMSGVVGLVEPTEVRLVSFTEAASYSHYEVNSSGRLIHYITTNISGTSYASRLDNGPAPSYLKQGTKYLSYDGHYFYTTDNYTVMQNDCNEGHRNNSVNSSSPYYNYFQYLSFRSYSEYSAAEINSIISKYISSSSKMKNLGSTFATYQYDYGVNALLAVAIAANESGWGSSNICQTKNNLFGINAIDISPGESAKVFATPQACVKDYMETYLSKRYCRPGYQYYNGAFLGNKASGANLKYASDPYWGEKAAAIAWKLDQAGGSEDAYKYTIGIKDLISTTHNNVNVRNGASLTSTVIYKTSGQSGYPVLLVDSTTENGFYKIQSDGVLNSARTAVNTSSAAYKMGEMQAYISSDYVTIVSESKNTDQIEYVAHVSEVGWMSSIADGAQAGTTGKAYPLEAICINIGDIDDLGVTYRTHVRNIGWQSFVSDGTMAGTTGQALSIEAIEIKLTGDKASQYDIYYSAHVANVGWLGWAKNGDPAGSSGYAYPMEAIKIQLVKKGASAPGSTSNAYMKKGSTTTTTSIPTLSCQAHVSNIGWMNTVTNSSIIGTTGKALPLEAVKLSVKNNSNLGISYSAHVRDIGWMSTVSNGATAGTTGRALSIEAIKISLTGTDASKYDIYYRAHVQNLGWLGWSKNGASAGTSGYALPVEALEIRIVVKGASAPGTTTRSFIEK